jgi:sugar-specific transcriptional regulator TrmB
MGKEITALTDLGFSVLEAHAYMTLVRASPLTGYRIAQLLHKPVTNTYKALDSLCRKGCIVVDQTVRPRQYSAMPISEYLDNVERDFRKRRAAAEAQVRSLLESPDYPGVYRMENLDQVYERAVRLIDGSGKSVLIDAFPVQIEKIRTALERAGKRKVKVFAKVYSSVQVRGADLVLSDLGTEIGSWPGELLFVVVDGSEYLLAFVNDAAGRVLEAVWSQNLYLSLIAYNSLLAELLITKLIEFMGDDPAYAPLRNVLKRYEPIHTHNTPAFKEFVRQFMPKGVKS